MIFSCCFTELFYLHLFCWCIFLLFISSLSVLLHFLHFCKIIRLVNGFLWEIFVLLLYYFEILSMFIWCIWVYESLSMQYGPTVSIEARRRHGTGVKEGYELPCGCQLLNWSLPEEYLILLASEPSLHVFIFYFVIFLLNSKSLASHLLKVSQISYIGGVFYMQGMDICYLSTNNLPLLFPI